MDFDQLCKKYNLIFQEKKDYLAIKKKLNLFHKGTIGIILMMLLASTIFYLTIMELNKGLIIYLGIFVILFILVFSIVTLLKEATDRVTITPKGITVKNSLKNRKIDMNSKIRLRLKSTEETERLKNKTSYHRVIELLLITDGEEIRLIDFMSPEIDREEVEFLGNELLIKINQSLVKN